MVTEIFITRVVRYESDGVCAVAAGWIPVGKAPSRGRYGRGAGTPIVGVGSGTAVAVKHTGSDPVCFTANPAGSDWCDR
ncbi:hypothetical protein GCM10010156_02920 [Planobispora rosea]|uniref:Uncharacterized protein n=1 Tax=Planobispora rosea TaxID=35762 RepID=A0A8J3RWY2_PLARO|nr:hypothetical protein GCM10010156_02920 [Planobispora rosea]GIH82195.1 hypothetical protein Pro02_06030 [Planobispora rosea]